MAESEATRIDEEHHYNIHAYNDWVNRDRRADFRNEQLRVGDKAPTFELPTVDGGLVNLDELTKDHYVALIITSSSAFPIVHNLPPIEAFYKSRANSPLEMVFIYTREIHPGEPIPPDGARYPAHETFEQKMDQARQLRDRYGLTMPVCVDDMIGTVHRAYLEMAFAQFVVDKEGVLMQRSEWAEAGLLAATLDNIVRHEEWRVSNPKNAHEYAYCETRWWRHRSGQLG